MIRWLLAAAVSILASGCMPFPRYSYLAESRVAVAADSGEFSDAEINRAKAVAADVAREIGMKSEIVRDDDFRLQRMISAHGTPPRKFLAAYYGIMRVGRPVKFRLEASEDGRVLYFTIFDYGRGTPSATVTRIRKLMIARVDAAFPNASIVHEAQSLGPFFDSILDAHQAVQPPSTGITAPVT